MEHFDYNFWSIVVPSQLLELIAAHGCEQLEVEN